jgi:predicted nucleic acid-binding protein
VSVLIECIEALPELFGQVLTTPQVVAELQQEKTPQIVRAWADSPPAWLIIESPLKIDFHQTLDIGEASAISLALERNANLVLIDERAGTQTARRNGMQTIGTLGLLIEAGLENLVDIEIALERLTTQTSFYASKGLIEATRRIFHDRKSK